MSIKNSPSGFQTYDLLYEEYCFLPLDQKLILTHNVFLMLFFFYKHYFHNLISGKQYISSFKIQDITSNKINS